MFAVTSIRAVNSFISMSKFHGALSVFNAEKILCNVFSFFFLNGPVLFVSCKNTFQEFLKIEIW